MLVQKPLKILHISNGNQKFMGLRISDIGRKLNNGFTRLGHDLWFFSDRDFVKFNAWLGIKSLQIPKANDAMLDTVKNFQPDLVIFGHAYYLKPETVAKMREALPQLKIMLYSVDALFIEKNVKYIKSFLPYIDGVFLTTAGKVLDEFKPANGFCEFMPNPVDSALEYEESWKRDKEYDFFTAMSDKALQLTDLRHKIPYHLQNKGLNCKFPGFNAEARIYGREYFESIAKSKICLNISKCGFTTDGKPDLSTMQHYTSDRLQHMMGLGSAVMTPSTNQLEDLYEDSLCYFDNFDDFCEKYPKLLDDEILRKNYGQKAYKIAHSRYNVETVCNGILAKL